MAQKRYSEQELSDMACDLLKSLKPKGLRIRDIKVILNHALAAVEYIVYGENDAPEISCLAFWRSVEVIS